MRTARKRDDEAADAVDHRVAGQLEELRAEPGRRRRAPERCPPGGVRTLTGPMVRYWRAIRPCRLAPWRSPQRVEQRARWVLDMLGAPGLRLGDDVPYRPEAWEAVERGELPEGDELAAGFFHLARVEERRSRAATSTDASSPPPRVSIRSTRRSSGCAGSSASSRRRYRGARFAVALTHDVDVPWRWTPIGVRGAAARLKGHALAGRAGPAAHEARGLARVPLHKLRGTDPNWRFAEIAAEERAHDARSTFFLMAGHGHRADGAAPEAYDRLRPRLVETLLEAGAEVGLHGSYLAAEDLDRLARERALLAQLDGPLIGHRYHYLRVDPHRNLVPLAGIGFRYDTSLGFPDALGFRAGIAHPFRPWDFERETVPPISSRCRSP